MDLNNFKSKFNFQQDRELFVGVERECFITDQQGMIMPKAFEVLQLINSTNDNPRFGYELSACQLESRTDPVHIEDLKDALEQNDKIASSALGSLHLGVSHREVAPYDMPLDIFPDPTGRYQQITKGMPEEILRAACRVIGTHVHIGMPDHETALGVYNAVIGHTDDLMQLGDGSNGERMEIYRMMAPDATPKSYASWSDFYSTACEKGFDQDPRKCWTLIRISVHGTLEFRMFGTTDDVAKIVEWASYCRELCSKAIQALCLTKY